jgi:hypothetical protein
MNNDIKNSFKESFLHEPSGEFTNIVEQKIAQLRTAPKPEKSNHWMLVVALFFMIGLPLFVVLFALFSQIQFPDFALFSDAPINVSWLNNTTQLFADFLPYLIYLLVFTSVYFIGRFLQNRSLGFSVSRH